MRKLINMDTTRNKQENGAVLITTLLILVILSIMSAFAMTISMIEQKVTLNSEVFQHNFYTVEAATLEGAARLDQIADVVLFDSTAFPAWLKVADPITIDLSQSGQWPSAQIAPSETTLNAVPVDITPAGYAPDGTTAGDRVWHAALDTGQCGSITDPTKEEHCYEVYGIYDIKRGAGKTYTGRMMMKVGYKKVLYH